MGDCQYKLVRDACGLEMILTGCAAVLTGCAAVLRIVSILVTVLPTSALERTVMQVRPLEYRVNV